MSHKCRFNWLLLVLGKAHYIGMHYNKTSAETDMCLFVTQAALLHIIDTGVQLGLRSTQGRTTAISQKKLAAACLAGLFLLTVGVVCLHAISVQNSCSSMHYS